MEQQEFNSLADKHNLTGDTRAACLLVLVDGATAYAAAKATGVNKSTVGRALKRLNRDTCESCGQVLP